MAQSFQSAANQLQQRTKAALDAAAQTLSENILREGRSDIANSGRFGPRWTMGFTADITGEGGTRTLTFRHAVDYWRTHQFGALIRGKPLLWIPLHEGDPRARDYPGRLFRVDRKGGGAPLLMSVDDKQVKYTGHEQVRIPKRFHLIEIIQAESKTLGALFRAEIAKS